MHRVLDREWDLGAHRAQATWLLGEMLRQHLARTAAGEWRLAGEHLVHDARQRVHVAPRVELSFAGCLLGAHVGGRPDGDPRVRDARLPLLLPHGARDAEVREQCLSVGEEDVLRLHVAVHETRAVREVEACPHLLGNAHDVAHRHASAAREPVAQRAVRDVRGHEIQESIRLARVDERHQVRMREPRRDADLAEEALRAERGAGLGVQHLDGDEPLVLGLAREVHGGHATAAELTLESESRGRQ